MEIKNKSLKNNTIYNMIKIVLLTIFPLITFPYASRILGIENIGKVQFANTIISFFSLFASLSINIYGIREGSPLKDDRKKISTLASELFSINIITLLLSFIILIICILSISKINAIYSLILIYSIQMTFLTIGFEWIYTIFEDYLFITIQSVIVQSLALLLTFILVKNPNDYHIYALIIVSAQSLIYLINFIRLKKYIDLRFIIHNNYKKHIKPMMLLFSNELSQRIYITSDVIILGLMATNYSIGIYTVTTKIYNIIKKILNSFCNVTVARLNYYNSKSQKKYINLFEKLFNITIFILLPTILLLFLFSSNIIEVISGKEYLEGSITLKFLSISLIFAVFANLFSTGILIIKKEEKYVLRGTIITAIINIILNLFLIPIYKQNGASVTTIISEFIMAIYSYQKAKNYISLKNIQNNITKVILGCIGIIITYLIINKITISNNFIYLTINGTICSIIYFIIEYILKNNVLISTINDYKEKIKQLKKEK